MRLGKIRRLLIAMLVIGVMSGTILAQEVTSTTTATVDDEHDSSGESSVTVASTEDGFEDERIEYLEKYGEAVGASVEKDNMRITVERIIADAYTYQMLVSVATIDGTPFKGDTEHLNFNKLRLEDKGERQIAQEKKKLEEALPEDADIMDYLKIEAQFNEEVKAMLDKYTKADGTLDYEGFANHMATDEPLSWGSSSSGYSRCSTTKNTASKSYYIYNGSTYEAMSNEMVLSIEGITQEAEQNYDITKTIIEYLEAHKDVPLETVPLEVSKDELESLEEMKLEDPAYYEEYKLELERQPKALLKEGKLGISIVPDEAYYIDNIGFINDAFHVRFAGTTQGHYNLHVSSKDDEWVNTVYNRFSSSRKDENTRQVVGYDAYAIKDIAALKEYTFKLSTIKVVEEIEGPFEMALTLKPFSEPKIINVNKRIPCYDDQTVLLKEIALNDHSISLSFLEVEEDKVVIERSVQVKLKDGTTEEIYSSVDSGKAGEATRIYGLDHLNKEDIQSIIIKGQEIAMQ